MTVVKLVVHDDASLATRSTRFVRRHPIPE